MVLAIDMAWHVVRNKAGTLCVSRYTLCFSSLASAIDDIQEEEENHYVDRLREYYLYAESIR